MGASAGNSSAFAVNTAKKQHIITSVIINLRRIVIHTPHFKRFRVAYHSRSFGYILRQWQLQSRILSYHVI